MNIAFDDIIMHQAVDDIGAFTVGGTDNNRMPEQVPLVDKAIDAHPLDFAKIFEGMVCVERIGTHLEFLTVTGRVQLI